MSNELAHIEQPRQMVPAHSYQDLRTMAQDIAKSNMFGVTTIEQAVTLLMLAQAEGIHPMTAVMEYHIIKGKPSLKADAMLARFQRAGGTVEWVERTDARVTAIFRHPASLKPLEVTWDDARCKRAELTGGNHGKFPAQMKSARVISEGVRACFPACLQGLYTPEEAAEYAEVEATPAPDPVQVALRVSKITPEAAVADDGQKRYVLEHRGTITAAAGEIITATIVDTGRQYQDSGVNIYTVNEWALRPIDDQITAEVIESE